MAVNAEAVSNDWNLNAYALLPVRDTEQDLNFFYQGGALNTYGLDVGYFITPELNASVGYYYQSGDLVTVDGSGVLGRLAYEISTGLTAGVNISYDEAFETRVSADLKVRFGDATTTALRKEVQLKPAINALTTTPRNRVVRINDAINNAQKLLVSLECIVNSQEVISSTFGPLDGSQQQSFLPGLSDIINQELAACTALGGKLERSAKPVD